MFKFNVNIFLIKYLVKSDSVIIKPKEPNAEKE